MRTGKKPDGDEKQDDSGGGGDTPCQAPERQQRGFLPELVLSGESDGCIGREPDVFFQVFFAGEGDCFFWQDSLRVELFQQGHQVGVVAEESQQLAGPGGGEHAFGVVEEILFDIFSADIHFK